MSKITMIFKVKIMQDTDPDPDLDAGCFSMVKSGILFILESRIRVFLEGRIRRYRSKVNDSKLLICHINFYTFTAFLHL